MNHSLRGVTTYDQSFISKIKSADFLYNSLIQQGQKERLTRYRQNLMVTRGDSEGSRNFDSKLYEAIFPYIRNKTDFNRTVKYLRNLTDKDGFAFSRSLKIYSSTQATMENFSKRDYTSFRWNMNYQKSLEEFTKMFSVFNFTPLSYKTDDDIRKVLPKENTHSGYMYIITGHKQKGENMDGILRALTGEEEEAIKTGSFSKPILCGFRTQASGEFEDDGAETNTCKHKTRVVCMVDMIQICEELRFAYHIQRQMASMDWYAGGKDEDKISMIIHGNHVKYPYFTSIDYSSYDQTISSWLIEDAFNVIKSAFKLNDRDEQLWNIMVHDFIHKQFVVGEGVVESNRGIPSGSMWTQIIGSLINCIIMRTFMLSKNLKGFMIAMGDDNAAFFNQEVSLDEISTYIIKNFGMIIKTDDKSNVGGRNDEVKFLSRYWTDFGTWRHPHQLISRILYSERIRWYNSEVTPYHVIYAFILTYRRGMEQLIDVPRFMIDHPFTRAALKKVDSHYLPGALAYIREYTMKRYA